MSSLTKNQIQVLVVVALLLFFFSGSTFSWSLHDPGAGMQLKLGDPSHYENNAFDTASIIAVILGVACLCGKREGQSIMEFLRTLTTSEKDVWLGGVCGGLGLHSGIPAWLWRLAFAGLIFGYGTGVLAYILLWIFVPLPRAQTNQEAGSPS